MEPYQTPILSNVTPPGSPSARRHTVGDRSPRSLMGSPYSMASPRLRSPQLQSPQLRSPPYMRRGTEAETKPQTPRLVIRKLVLINYKSYAGRQEVGPFNENFTAVVGPNGSGKSNVIDSLLFVFGFRAKKMRQDKLTGLIHKSEEKPDLQFARVEVHFETVGIPGSELVVAREVRRDGNNFYSVNDKRCSYGEVSELLEQRGIDLRHKRFLILQGEVESIALMPAKAENDGDDGLLEYLEDIIGTSTYKSRIEELEQETEVLREDCDEKQRRVDIVYKDLKKLDAERAEIEKVMRHQNRGTVARSQLWQLYAHRINNAIALLDKEIEEDEANISHLLGETSSKRKLLAELESNATTNNKEAQRLKENLKDVTKKLKEAQLIQVKAKQRQDQLQGKQRKAERNLAHARNEHKSAQIWLENYSKDSKALEQKLKNVITTEATERTKLEAIQAELHESTKDLHNELESLQIQAEPWREKISAKNQELRSAESDLTEARKEVEEARNRERECVSSAERVISAGHAAQKQVKTLNKYYSKLEKDQQELDTTLSEVVKEKDGILQSLEQLRPEVASAQEARISSQNRNRLESELMRLKIPGLYGRLGSLGSIDEKYDIAISTAGAELNNFVVDTVETAKKCIEVLRTRSIGRAKFMVLNKLKQHSPADGRQFPAPRLVDLVKPVDPLFSKAFASILGDTMVVSTSEEATKVAFGGPRRHKVVTLGGMLVNTSGQMGGGGTPSRGLMAKAASTVSPEELERLEKQLAALELDYVEVKERHAGMVARKDEIAAELPRLRIELEKEKMSLGELTSQMAIIKETRRKLQAAVATKQEAEVQRLDAYNIEKARITTELQDLESQSASVERAIQQMQNKILEAGGLRLREQSARVSDLQKEEADIHLQIEEGQEKVAQESSRLSKLAVEIDKLERELEECENSDISHQEIPDTHALETESHKLAAYLDNHTNLAEEAKTQANDVRASIEENRAAEVEAQNNLEKLRVNLKVNHNKKNDILQKLKHLKLHDISMAKSLETVAPSSAEDNRNSQPAPSPAADSKNDALPDGDVTMGGADVKEEPDRSGSEDSGAEEDEEDRAKLQQRSNGSSGNDEQSLTELSPDELDGLNEGMLKSIISSSEEASKAGRIDTETLANYRNRYTEYLERRSVGDEAVATYERVKDEVHRLKKRRYSEFMDGFLQISAKLKEMYQLITMGGNAELELVDTMDPFAEGILFSVMPPKKSWRNIANLSGGEKTLSSLALVFALHHYKPTPLYVMDEIDAALDFRNVSIIANYIKERTKDGQFIVISLRNNMFELASRLVGVYKVDNMTRSVTLQTN